SLRDINLSGNLTNTGAGATGILITANTGTFAAVFSGATKTLHTGASAAVTVTGNSISTGAAFIGGGLDIVTSTGTGINASGGIFTVTGTGNTINASAGQALLLNNVNLLGTAVIFDSVTSGGGTN